MPYDTLTLELEGEVSLAAFAVTMERFKALVTALVEHCHAKGEVQWQIAELHAGSAEVTIRGETSDSEALTTIAQTYVAIGEALARGGPLSYPERIMRPAQELTHVLGEAVVALRFAAAEREAVVTTRADMPALQRTYAWGELTGIVETLQRHWRLQCTLYDVLLAKPVVCRLRPEHEETIRALWGKTVVVSGRIGRDPVTGHPVEVRDIRDIRPVEPVPPGSYQRARGILDLGEEPPEVLVRRLRDAE